MKKQYHLGFDVGGTRLKGALVSDEGDLIDNDIRNISGQPFDAVYAAMREMTESWMASRSQPPTVVGAAIPGLVEPEFGSINLPGKIPGIEGFPLATSLRDLTGAPAWCINDGAAATIAEARFGAAKGHTDVVGITLGTGVGSGVIIGGRPLSTGHPGGGQLIGHFTVVPDGEPCLCGSRGCAETLLSAQAIVGQALAMLGRGVPSSLAQTQGNTGSLDLESIIAAYEIGDPIAEHLIEDFRKHLGALLVTAAHAYNPTAIVLSGGPVAASRHFLPQVSEYVNRHVFRYPPDRTITVVAAALTHQAGVLGAVANALVAFEYQQPDVTGTPGLPSERNTQ